MYPTDVREFTTQRLVAQIAQALRNETVLELGQLYDELNFKPSTTASYHAAAAAVHVLLAHEAGSSAQAEQALSLSGAARRPQLAPAPNGSGAGPKGGAGAPGHARQLKSDQPIGRLKKRRATKSSSTRTSKPRTARELLRCSICDKPFMTAGRLRNHMRDQHGDAPAQPSSSVTAGTAA